MINLIVAPLSECVNSEDYCKRIVAYLKEEKVDYSVYFSPKLEDVKTNAHTLSTQGETEFIIIGNDIILHTFLNAVKDVSKIKFGIIRTGKDDDFAKYLGIPSSPIQAVKDILTKNVDNVDYLSLNGLIVADNILIGASAEVYELYSQHKLKNPLTLQHLRNKYGSSFSGTELSIEIKGEEKFTKNFFVISIANGGLSKGSHVSPLSNMKDGLLNLNYAEVDIIKERGKYLKELDKGNSIYDDTTQQKWVNNVKITNANGEIKALVDGSIMSFDNVSVSVIPNGLNVYKAK